MNGSITAETQTINMKPGESHTLVIRFNGIKPCAVRFELTDYDSGTITPEGVYTAPNREGSFEIRIQCVEYPETSTYTYVDVRN